MRPIFANSQSAARPSREGQPRCIRGFTLIEVMIVVAILGVILATGIPPMARAMQKQGMTKAVADILEACKEARADAVISQKKTELVIHPFDGTIRAGKFSGQIPQGVSILSVGVNWVQYVQADEARVGFYPNGTSDEFIISIQGSDGEQKHIKLDIITACPEVSDQLPDL